MKQVITGNTGPKVRSDIEVTLELTESGGIELNLKSKVKREKPALVILSARRVILYPSLVEKRPWEKITAFPLLSSPWYHRAARETGPFFIVTGAIL